MSRYFNYTEDDYVAHFGIKGMKWGLRRYQNNDGSLTPSGRTRYLDKPTHAQKKAMHQAKKDAKENVAKIAAASLAGLAIGAGIAFYAKNKPQIDSFVHSKMNNGFKPKMEQPLYKVYGPDGVRYTPFKMFTPEGFKPEGFDFKTFKPD